jgi:integrase
MVSIRKRWYNLRCPECRSPDLRKASNDRYRCPRCGKLVYRNKEAYSKWVIDYVDMHGQRHLETCPKHWSKKQARERAADLEKDPGGNPHITFEEVAQEWLKYCEAKVKIRPQRLRPQSLADYRRKLRHMLPKLGQRKIKSIKKPMILDLLLTKVNEGLSGRTVSEIRGRLFAVFEFAIACQYLTTNPVAGITKELALMPASDVSTVRAFSNDQRALFLETAFEEDPGIFPVFFALDRTGMRVGECTALKPEDVDIGGRNLHIRRTWVGPKIQEKPKSKAGLRTIDMSLELCDMLRGIMRDRISPWLFLNEHGRPFKPRAVARRFKEVIKIAKLPEHFTPHSFRHTYATRALEAGCSIEWIKAQLGHEDLRITDKLYGRWAKISDKEAADRLDDGWAKRQGKLEWMNPK